MTKLEIFNDIVSIMARDSATCKDKGKGDPAPYGAMLREDMTDEAFLLTVGCYLASFGVREHLAFGKRGRKLRPFTVRRIGDALYVDRANPEAEVQPGERLLALDDHSIPALAEARKELLYHEAPERQDWSGILRLASQAMVEGRDGHCRSVSLSWTDHRQRRQPYEFRQLDSGLVYLRFDDFMDGSAIAQLLSYHGEEISAAEAMVVDLRENAGGSDAAFAPLLPYCLEPGEHLPRGIGKQEIHYSQRNVALRLEQLKAYQAQLPAEQATLVNQVLVQLEENCGKGFVPADQEDWDVQGAERPRRVYVLSDCHCCSSGESFVELVRGRKKVTVVGRPTMGILDYSNCASVSYGDYWFQYPTSRRMALDEGSPMGQTGIPVDVEIPFSPDHLLRDVDLETVLALEEKRKCIMSTS